MQADSLLAKIEATGFKLSPQIREQLDATRTKWEREMMIRRLEEAADDLPRVLFETTAGNFVVELFENQAPKTVGNFISLVEKRFYDDLTFHLVKPGQLAQTGCPIGDGTGDAGYKIPDETAVEKPVTISPARSAWPIPERTRADRSSSSPINPMSTSMASLRPLVSLSKDLRRLQSEKGRQDFVFRCGS